MSLITSIVFVVFLIFTNPSLLLSANDSKIPPFQGQVNADSINIRSDSTVSAELICKVNKGDYLEVVSELYNWYKVKLPVGAPSFIKNNLVKFLGSDVLEISKNRVNIRLRPNMSSPIVGKIEKGERVKYLAHRGRWLKVEPTGKSFGWIHTKFVDKITPVDRLENIEMSQAVEEDKQGVDILEPESEGLSIVSKPRSTGLHPWRSLERDKDSITVSGLLKRKFIRTVATHKLITDDRTVFLLRDDKERLDLFKNLRVRVIGEIDYSFSDPLIEIIEIKLLEDSG